MIRAIMKPTKISSVVSLWIFVRTFFWQCFDNLERLTQGQNKHRTCLHSNLFVCKRIQNVLLTCNDCFLMLATMVIFEYHAIFWDANLKLKLLKNLHFVENVDKQMLFYLLKIITRFIYEQRKTACTNMRKSRSFYCK